MFPTSYLLAPVIEPTYNINDYEAIRASQVAQAQELHEAEHQAEAKPSNTRSNVRRLDNRTPALQS
jgi:hypothetical protein